MLKWKMMTKWKDGKHHGNWQYFSLKRLSKIHPHVCQTLDIITSDAWRQESTSFFAQKISDLPGEFLSGERLQWKPWLKTPMFKGWYRYRHFNWSPRLTAWPTLTPNNPEKRAVFWSWKPWRCVRDGQTFQLSNSQREWKVVYGGFHKWGYPKWMV